MLQRLSRLTGHFDHEIGAKLRSGNEFLRSLIFSHFKAKNTRKSGQILKNSCPD